MNDFPLDRLIAFLPQKPPSLFVEHVVAVEPMRRVEGTVSFAQGHRVFENHLPDEPLVPGVIIIEALAQIAGIALMSPGGEPVRGFISEVGQTRFYRVVRPGECIRLQAEVERAFGQHARFGVQATVNGDAVARGTITLTRRIP